MSGLAFLEICTQIALVVLTISFLVAVVRIVLGPSLADRVLALDMLVSIGIGYIAVIALRTGFSLYLDVAISLSLVGFLATAAFARFILKNASSRHTSGNTEGAGK